MIEIALAFLIVAHRGASAEAPENTLPAFQLAWEQGADAIEADFHMSRDGHLVCIHDEETGKVADQNLIVAKSTLAELQTLDVGSSKGVQYAGTRIPTLPEVLATVPDGKMIFIEVKTGVEVIPALQKALAASSLSQDQIRVISFDADFVTAWKKANPACQTMLIISHNRQRWRLSPSEDQTLALLRETGADGLSTNTHRAVYHRLVKRLQAAGFQHHVWTVNSARLARRFVAYGTLSITTDRPGALREELAK